MKGPEITFTCTVCSIQITDQKYSNDIVAIQKVEYRVIFPSVIVFSSHFTFVKQNKNKNPTNKQTNKQTFRNKQNQNRHEKHLTWKLVLPHPPLLTVRPSQYGNMHTLLNAYSTGEKNPLFCCTSYVHFSK